MNVMIATLKVNVNKLKEDLPGVKQSFQKEIDGVKDRIQAAETKVKVTADDISKLQQESRSERNNFATKLRTVESDTDKALKQVNSQLTCLRKEH